MKASKTFVAALILCTLLAVGPSCDREAMHMPQDGIQVDVTVEPPVIGLGDSFTIKLEISNSSDDEYVIQYNFDPYYYGVFDDVGCLCPTVVPTCAPGTPCPTYEYILEPASVTDFEIPLDSESCFMLPGIYTVRAGIAGVLWADSKGTYFNEAVLIVEPMDFAGKSKRGFVNAAPQGVRAERQI